VLPRFALHGCTDFGIACSFYNGKGCFKISRLLFAFDFYLFFYFHGDLENIPAVKDTLQNLITGRELVISVFASQAISNVPAALLLSEFTDNYRVLLKGVNIGGLGL